LNRGVDAFGKLPSTDFILVGALTELNYNIVTSGVGLRVAGIGGGARMAVVNVALDLRVINSKNFAVSYISTLQKQIYGYEVSADVFRFFDTTFVELQAGAVRNEPLQLGVRSIAEMAVYQIMTDFLRLPRDPSCALVENDHMSSYLEQLKPNGETK
jgi:curli production assembly/transport component CsgG/holdfast attachment protein HfaB